MNRLPENLTALVEYGIIQEVVRPLMSGKEAQIYLVVSEGEERVAKVYKEAHARTFKHRAEYTEGRKTRNSRDQRAIDKRTRHGRTRDEAAWRSTEVDMIHRLRDAGVRVPEPHRFVDGVLVMELIRDAAGMPAPRLGDLTFRRDEALAIYEALIGQVVRMLCAGVVHGDLSEFNVLMGAAGPTLIDFPQAVDPASNQNGRRLLIRDVENLHRFLARFARHLRFPLHAEEMWELYQGNRLTPTTKLAGTYRASEKKTDTTEVLTLIGEAGAEERARREARGEDVEPLIPKPRRTVVDFTREVAQAPTARRVASALREERVRTGNPTAAETGLGVRKPRRRGRRRPKREPTLEGGAPPAPRSEVRRDRHARNAAPGAAPSDRSGSGQPTARPTKPRSRRRRRPAARPRES